MTSSMGSLDPKPWWRSRRAHAAAGPGGSVSVYCEGLSAEAPDTGARVLDRIALGFRSGSVTAILDPTGVRSRALFRLIAGLEAPTEGRVDVRSRGARRGDRIGAVALVHEASPLDPTLTVRENLILPLALTGVLAGADQFASAIATAGLAVLVDEPAKDLSAADRFRVLLARALVCGGDVVLVEDPLHLPAPERRSSIGLVRALAAQGSTLLIATADPEFAALADRAILLRDGRVSADLVAPTSAAVRDALGTGAEDPATLLGPVPSALPSSIDEAAAAHGDAKADEPVAAPPPEADSPAGPAGPRSREENAVEDRRVGPAERERPHHPIFHPLTPTPAEQAREQGEAPEAAADAADAESSEPEALLAAADADESEPASKGAIAAATEPSPAQPLRRDDDPDPITQAIRILARSGPAHPAHDPDAVFTASDARTAPLPEEPLSPAAPTPEQAEVIDRARRILDELPGPIVPED